MSIISIQSHVAYGYVGNKVATYPLQNMGFDVIPINTVQFSNHTGYGKWTGDIYKGESIKNIVDGIFELGFDKDVEAVLSGYMGSADICNAVYDVVKKLKSNNKNLIYLCDPVIGNTSCFVKPEVADFFKTNLKADIITPNQFEAEFLSNIKITNMETLKESANYFHKQGCNTVIITGIKLENIGYFIFISENNNTNIIKTKEFDFKHNVNGTGDLFSAVYLGSYLKTKDTLLSLQIAVFHLESVLANNLKTGKRELQVLSTDYKIIDNTKLIPVLKV